MSKPNPFSVMDVSTMFQQLEHCSYDPPPDEIEKLGTEARPHWFGVPPNQYRALCFPEMVEETGNNWRCHTQQDWFDQNPDQDPKIRIGTYMIHPKHAPESNQHCITWGQEHRVTRAAFDQVWERAMTRTSVG